MVKHKQKRQHIVRLSAGITLASLGLCNLALPVLSLGTAAGTNISNTATAEFNDPSQPDPNDPKTTTSNTVEVTIAEVAGITNVAQLPIDTNGGSVIPGDTVQFPFDVTNTGNDETDIFIPLPANVTTTNLSDPRILIDVDGDGTPDVTINNDGTLTGTPPAGFTVTPTLGNDGYLVSSIDPDDAITVIIEGEVAPGLVSGSQITAQLGDTNSNDSSNPDSQNQPDNADTPLTNEVRTVDNNTADGNTTAPVNGEREAADTAEPLVVGTVAPDPLAVATISKVAVSVDDGGTTGTTAPLTGFDDDVITYNLSLEVDVDVPPSVSGDYVAADLVGATINLGTAADGSDATPQQRILVSDVIPAQTELEADPIAPAGWIPVYSTTPITGAGDDALAATWVTTRPATASDIVRVGFVNNPAVLTSVAVNTSVNGFVVSVVTTNIVADGTDVDGDGDTEEPTPIYNLAQVLGVTEGDGDFGPDGLPNTPDDVDPPNVVFDESGDENPNNFDDDGTPPADENGNTDDDPYGDFDPNGDNGDPGTPPDGDADIGNNNTGTGDEGEPNKVELNDVPEPPAPGNLLNGPVDEADAEGTIGNNDDFTNAPITEGVSAGDAAIDPAAVPIQNSVRNVSGIDLDNVVIRPIAPSLANDVCPTCDYEINPLIDGTEVTITTPDAQTATYIWDEDADPDGAGPEGNTGAFVLNAGATVELPTLAVGEEVDYTVSIDLPNGEPFKGYSIPLVSYVNNDGNDAFNPTTELINNVTIDNVFTGFLRITKSAQIFYADGGSSAVFGTVGDLNNDGDVLDAGETISFADTGDDLPAPGDRIRYVVTYENISAAATGADGSVALNAQNLVITENGLGADPEATGNNWALDQDGNGEIDTSNVTGSAVVGGDNTGSISYFNGDPAALGTDITGTTAASDVTQYVNTVGTVNPGESGTFSFQRLIN